MPLSIYLFFYKIFENHPTKGENTQSIQSLNCVILSTTISNPTPLIPFTLADCRLFDMISKLESTYIKRENRKKGKVKLEKLN